jgi:heme A synthase
MTTFYRVLAYAIGGLVAVQAGAMAFGVAGLSHSVKTGGVIDRAAFDGNPDAFPEATGLALHEINGGIVIPALALLLLVASAFAKIPRGSWWAGGVFALVAVQTMLGYSAADLPALGALHGLNALLLFATALVAGRRARAVADAPLDTEPVRSTAEV